MSEAGDQKALGAGAFYGAVQSRREQCDAIFTDLRHTLPRKLPSHSHELPFFAVLMEGLYGERYGREERQFRPFTVHFRPAGVPHQDEIGPPGVRFFEIEIRDRKSTRLNSSHCWISYAVFCLKKKNTRRKSSHCWISYAGFWLNNKTQRDA